MSHLWWEEEKEEKGGDLVAGGRQLLSVHASDGLSMRVPFGEGTKRGGTATDSREVLCVGLLRAGVSSA